MKNPGLECKAVVPLCIEGPKSKKKSRRLTIVEVDGAFGFIDFRQVKDVSSRCTPAATGSSCEDMLRAARARVEARGEAGAKFVMLQSQVLSTPPPHTHTREHTMCPLATTTHQHTHNFYARIGEACEGLRGGQEVDSLARSWTILARGDTEWHTNGRSRSGQALPAQRHGIAYSR